MPGFLFCGAGARLHWFVPIVKVQIVRFVEDHQPGFVECELCEADGGIQRFIDKIPMFTSRELWSDSEFPQPGWMRCKVSSRFVDREGLRVARISTVDPDRLESVDGRTDFVVPEANLMEDAGRQ